MGQCVSQPEFGGARSHQLRERLSLRRKRRSDGKYSWGEGDCDAGVWEGREEPLQLETGDMGEEMDFSNWGEVVWRDRSQSIGSWGDNSESGRKSRGSGRKEEESRGRKSETSLYERGSSCSRES